MFVTLTDVWRRGGGWRACGGGERCEMAISIADCFPPN